MDGHTLLWSLTLRARPLRSAGAGVPVDPISTGASILAGITGALVHILITVLTRPTRVTATDVSRSCVLRRHKKSASRMLWHHYICHIRTGTLWEPITACSKTLTSHCPFTQGLLVPHMSLIWVQPAGP